MTRTTARDIRCPRCGAPPGHTCRAIKDGIAYARRPHNARRQAARTATLHADPTRCDRCGRPWPAHAQRHRQTPA